MIKFNQKIARIAIFYFIAAIFSYYFRVQTPEWYNQFYLPFGLSVIKEWLSALGILLGALFVTLTFKPERRNSLFGTSVLKSLLMAIIVVLLFTIIGIQNNENLNPHLYGFFIGIWLFIYCLLEESGWRGYLQDELRNMHPVLQYLIIGFFWYIWHLTFLNGRIDIVNELIIFLILFSASVGIGLAVKHTQSIVVAACLHMLGNILAFSSLIKESISLQNRLIIIGISLVVWIIILIYWDKTKLVRSANQS